MKQPFEGEKKNIKVSSIELKTLANGSIMTKLTDEKGLKYSFFNTKRDGNPTAASESFKGITIGDTIEIGYVEEEKEFLGDKGQVKYTQRTIRFLDKVNPDGNYEMNANGSYAPGQDVHTDAPF